MNSSSLSVSLNGGKLMVSLEVDIFRMSSIDHDLVSEVRRCIDRYEIERSLLEQRREFIQTMRSRGLSSDIVLVVALDGERWEDIVVDEPFWLSPREAAAAVLDGAARQAGSIEWREALVDRPDPEPDDPELDNPEPDDQEDNGTEALVDENETGVESNPELPSEPDPSPPGKRSYAVPTLGLDDLDQMALLWDWTRTGSIKSACQRHQPSVPVATFRALRDADFPQVPVEDRPVFLEYDNAHLILAREGDMSGRWGRKPGTPLRRSDAYTIAHRNELVVAATNELVEGAFIHDAAAYLTSLFRGS